MLEYQNYGCAICGDVDEYKNLAVDHCHSTGVVRGLLCANCNRALGLFNDNENILIKAIEYLRKRKL